MLRNVIDNIGKSITCKLWLMKMNEFCFVNSENGIILIGTEIRYYLYDPTIVKIDVMKLEKRLDEELYYLRDALPEYSTFPEDMEPELLPEGVPVPINTTKVRGVPLLPSC